MAPRKKRSNPDHAHQYQRPSPSNEIIEQQLKDLLTPAVEAQKLYYRELGLRERLLTLPLMLAAVLTLLWRQVPSVHELTRLLARENLLWCQTVQVTQKALSGRFLTFPAELFERVFWQILPQLQQRWQQRQQRPLPAGIAFARQHFEQIWLADGSTLEALFRKLKSLQEAPKASLAGKMAIVVDLVTRLPRHIWFCEDPNASDTRFEADLLAAMSAKTLLIIDRGFYHFQFFADIIANHSHFISRPKQGAKVQVEKILSQTHQHKDQIIILGGKRKDAPQLRLRWVEVRFEATCYCYITSVLDPQILPPFVVVDLYRRRWRIEEAFFTVKRLLKLSYLWTGSLNGVKLQLWATWLFYAVLVDLGDAVADELGLPFERISLEMLYRGLYHFTVAYHKGTATDPVQYFAAPENQDLAVVKTVRKPPSKLDLSPFPGKGLTFAPSS